jgi:hypothetical protein
MATVKLSEACSLPRQILSFEVLCPREWRDGMCVQQLQRFTIALELGIAKLTGETDAF